MANELDIAAERVLFEIEARKLDIVENSVLAFKLWLAARRAPAAPVPNAQQSRSAGFGEGVRQAAKIAENAGNLHLGARIRDLQSTDAPVPSDAVDLRAALAQAKTITDILSAKVKRMEDQQNGHRPDFLLNGTRFKLNFSARGNVDVFHAYAKELQGRWVALAPAEDDSHLARPATPPSPAPSAPVQGLTDAELIPILRGNLPRNDYDRYMNGDVLPINPDCLRRIIDRAIESRLTGQGQKGLDDGS